jgi:hypothetical protein
MSRSRRFYTISLGTLPALVILTPLIVGSPSVGIVTVGAANHSSWV